MSATESIARFFVVTGGPGSGKSTLLDALADHGIARSTEAGRAVIRDQRAIGGNTPPWADRHAFAEMMLGFEMRSYRMAEAMRGPVIFDRGVPDIIGYRALCDLPPLDHVDRAARLFRYNRRIIVAPPWPAIFVQDAERKQTLAEAAATFRAVCTAYETYGYELTTLPCAPIEARVEFVLAHIAHGEDGGCI